MSNIEEDIKLKEISERFNNGTETLEDIMNYCRNYEIKFENGLELRVVEKRYFDKLVERIKEVESKLEEANKQLDLDYVDKNYIPVEKVKEGLEYIEDYFDRLNGPDEDIEYIRKIKNRVIGG